MFPVKINQLEIENVKRIKACAFAPSDSGLTIIGGDNAQGKTSVLDTIAWALGGERYRPSNPQRDGSVLPPSIKVTLSNGIVVERTGKNSSLKVTDSTGRKSGQQLLNEFVSQLAIDLPQFLQASNKEKANGLLRIIGVGDQLLALDQQETQKYSERHTIGQIADRKKKFADEMQAYSDVPAAPLSASELILQQQDILARNGENQRLRRRAAELEAEKQQLKRELDALTERYSAVCADCDTASRSAADLQDESTAELEANIAEIDDINRKVRANLDKEKAEDDAAEYGRQYAHLDTEIDEIRKQRMALLSAAQMPLEGLSVQDGELTYRGQRWDCMSGAEQLIVGTAIARAFNPKCGFVLMDRLEQMDMHTIQEFGGWLQREGLQVIATRVSTGPECSIVIEDGIISQPVRDNAPKQWQKGVF